MAPPTIFFNLLKMKTFVTFSGLSVEVMHFYTFYIRFHGDFIQFTRRTPVRATSKEVEMFKEFVEVMDFYTFYIQFNDSLKVGEL